LNTSLANSIRTGDEKVFEKLFKDHYPMLCGYARKYINDIDQAEEIVQDTFFTIWQKRAKMDINVSIVA
jgi:RNA polymerase sigma-70 factor (ECF subfamily)